MKVVNSTRWSTRDIRAIVLRTAKQRFTSRQIKWLVVRVDYRSGRGWFWAGTHSRYNATNIRLVLPRTGTVDPADMAAILYHEMGHSLGANHREMTDRNFAYRTNGPGSPLVSFRRVTEEQHEEWFGWAKALPIRHLIPPAKARDVTAERDQRLTLAHAGLARWTTKSRRAATAIRKYKATISRIERTIRTAAAARALLDRDP